MLKCWFSHFRCYQLRWFVLVFIVLMLDQLSKQTALHYLSYAQAVEITSWANWILVFNTGMAFSFFTDARLVLTILSLVMIVFLICWLLRVKSEQIYYSLSLAMIIGGALGNVVDRFRYGAVVDFIQLHLGGYYWPVFNVADSFICVGAVLLMLASWQSQAN